MPVLFSEEAVVSLPAAGRLQLLRLQSDLKERGQH